MMEENITIQIIEGKFMGENNLSGVPTKVEIESQLESLTCERCMKGDLLPFDFSFAFQPIVDIGRRTVHSYEALVRGPNGQGAASVLSMIDRQNRFRFDQLCRAKAISLASMLEVETFLNINFLVNAVYDPDQCIKLTLECARKNNFPIDRIILETTEEEKIEDPKFLKSVLDGYRKYGLMIAIDDFGEGYSSLNLLASLHPEYLKLDRQLVTMIGQDRVRERIVKAIVDVCRDLSIKVIGEGVETLEEARVLRDLGVTLFQGYFFARPGFESLPPTSNMEF
jgi:EAL domain-containing protein (putative c-di-GMP-specific phosphodiesterase class I)